jgi:hypothetical protein
MTSEPNKPPRPPKPASETGSDQGTSQVDQLRGSLERITRRLQVNRAPEHGPNHPQRRVPIETIEMLIAALGDTAHPRHAVAVNELVEIGAPAVPAICAALQDQHSWLTVYRAAEAAGRIGDGRASGRVASGLAPSQQQCALGCCAGPDSRR